MGRVKQMMVDRRWAACAEVGYVRLHRVDAELEVRIRFDEDQEEGYSAERLSASASKELRLRSELDFRR